MCTCPIVLMEGKFPAPVMTPGGELDWWDDELDAHDEARPRVNYAPANNDEGAATVAA